LGEVISLHVARIEMVHALAAMSKMDAGLFARVKMIFEHMLMPCIATRRGYRRIASAIFFSIYV
jgi:hypothetical protein